MVTVTKGGEPILQPSSPEYDAAVLVSVRSLGGVIEGECPLCEMGHFKLDTEKNKWTCSECGNEGHGPIGFTMRQKSLDHWQAVRWLAHAPLAYLQRGLPVFPLHGVTQGSCSCGQQCPSPGKHPRTSDGFKSATSDQDQVLAWLKKWPDCNWGMATGQKSGIVVLDIDGKNGGFESWEMLRDEHPGPLETPLVTTGGEQRGQHWYFRYPENGRIKSSAGKLGSGLDIRGEGGYVVIPPSVTIHPYEFDLELDTDLATFPDWLLSAKSDEGLDPIERAKHTNDFARALMYLNSLSERRCEDYEAWVEVGMALSGLGEFGLQAWDAWSHKSPKYQLGECAKKWRTFTPNEGLTIESLQYWAHEDNPEQLFDIPEAPSKNIKPSDYMNAMRTAGWDFRLNEADHSIQFNGMILSNELTSVIYCSLFEQGYKSRELARDCWTNLAFHNSFHPVLDYLYRLEWDGEDHIKKLASYFTDKHGVFDVWLRRWLIGAVAKVADYPRGQQNRMLVLDGAQDLGKSFFARWLATDVPSLHHEGPINPENKDDTIRLMGTWIWEVAELGSTFRKADREALKFFITKERVKERKPYGREDTRRPAMASFIGTLNNEAGFLSDPTGSRRFMVATLTGINWDYATEVDVSQLWAQAFALFRQGEPWDLLPDEAKLAAEINSEYEIENPIEDYIRHYFEINPDERQWFAPTVAILEVLKSKKLVQGKDRSAAMEIGSALRGLGCDRDRRRIDGKKTMGWIGVQRRLGS